MKRILIIALTSVLVLCGCIITGCTTELWKPYITVEGLKTEYEVGDTLDLDSAKVIYYAEETETEHTEIPLTEDMIIGFSTEEPGTFTMLIIYKDLSVTAEYVVKVKDGNNNDNNDDQGGQDSEIPDGALTETQALECLGRAIEKMLTYSEIREDITGNMFGFPIEGHQITTANKSYTYSGEDSCSWIVKEQGNYYMYEISYGEYKKYTITEPIDDVRQFVYVSSEISTFEEMPFVESYKTGSEYVIVCIESVDDGYGNSIETKMEIKFTDNGLKSINIYMGINSEYEKLTGMEFTYYSTETSIIPSIPQNVEWMDAGEYVEDDDIIGNDY